MPGSAALRPFHPRLQEAALCPLPAPPGSGFWSHPSFSTHRVEGGIPHLRIPLLSAPCAWEPLGPPWVSLPPLPGHTLGPLPRSVHSVWSWASAWSSYQSVARISEPHQPPSPSPSRAPLSGAHSNPVSLGIWKERWSLPLSGQVQRSCSGEGRGYYSRKAQRFACFFSQLEKTGWDRLGRPRRWPLLGGRLERGAARRPGCG